MALIFLPGVALANVEITHVEYDLPGSDAGREWIEITNKGTDSIDLTGYKFREGGVNHKMTLESGSAVLGARVAAVIVEDPNTFLSEHPGFSETIFKSSFSLSNTGETIALVNASSTVITSLTYTAAPKPPAAPKKSTTVLSAKTTVSSKSSAQTDQTGSPVYAAPDAASQPDLPPIALWIAGLIAIVGLGIAGALYARMSMPQRLETSLTAEEFEIQ